MRRKLRMESLASRKLMAADTFVMNVDIQGDSTVDVIIADGLAAGVQTDRGVTTVADIDPEEGSVFAAFPAPGILFVEGFGTNEFQNLRVQADPAADIDIAMSGGMAELAAPEVIDDVFAVIYDDPSTPEPNDIVVVDNVDAAIAVEINGEVLVTTDTDGFGADWQTGMISTYNSDHGGIFAFDFSRYGIDEQFVFGIGNDADAEDAETANLF